LRPTYAIWLLAENLLPNDQRYAHHYKFRDDQGESFVQHGGIYLLELTKFHAQQIENEQQRWLKFFKEGEALNDNALPDWMNIPEMKQAMSTLTAFSEKDREYFKYQARQEYLREQRAILREREDEAAKAQLAQEETAKAQEEAAKAQEETAKAQEEAVKAREEATKAQEEAAKARKEAAKAQEEYRRQQQALQLERDEAKQEITQAKQETQAAQAEIERLKMLLAQK